MQQLFLLTSFFIGDIINSIGELIITEDIKISLANNKFKVRLIE